MVMLIYQSNATYHTMSSATINLSGLSSAISDIVNIFLQYWPLILTVGVMIGIVQYVINGFGGLLGSITGVFGGV